MQCENNCNERGTKNHALLGNNWTRYNKEKTKMMTKKDENNVNLSDCDFIG